MAAAQLGSRMGGRPAVRPLNAERGLGGCDSTGKGKQQKRGWAVWGRGWRVRKIGAEVGKGCQDISLMKDLPSSRKKRKQCDNNDKYLLNTY